VLRFRPSPVCVAAFCPMRHLTRPYLARRMQAEDGEGLNGDKAGEEADSDAEGGGGETEGDSPTHKRKSCPPLKELASKRKSKYRGDCTRTS
jgi:hypothetical protein